MREFFHEKLQMIFSSSHTSSILRKAPEGKRQTIDKSEAVQSLMDRKEMRVKKLDFESKMHSSEALDAKEREIKNLLEQHQRLDTKIIDHYKRETSQQEDVFQRKMRERKDRSVERSLSKSVDMGGRKREQNKPFKEVEATGTGRNGGWKGALSQVSPSTVLGQKDVNLPLQTPKEAEKTSLTGNILTDSIVTGGEKMDAFSAKKVNALNAKLSKMRMFDEEFASKM